MNNNLENMNFQSLPTPLSIQIPSNTSPSNKLKTILIIGGISVGIIVLIIVGLIGVTRSTAKKLSVCLDQYNNDMDKILSLKEQERWSKQRLCVEGKSLTESLISCNNKVEQSNQRLFQLTLILYSIVDQSVRKVTTENLINFQNQTCRDFPEALIQY